MKAGIWTGTCVAMALAATVGLVAQGGTTPISFVGCIQKVDPAPAGTAGAFLATNVTSVSVPARYPEGAITRLYRLDADAAKVTPHVGHLVAIEGTLAMAPNSEKAPPPPPANFKAPPAPTAATAPMVKVTAVTMKAPTCP